MTRAFATWSNAKIRPPPLADANIRRRLSAEPSSRVISLRQEMSAVFARLLHAPAKTQCRFELDERYLPAHLRGRTVVVDSARLLLRLSREATVNGLVLRVAGGDLNAFAPSAELGGLRASPLPAAFAQGLIGQHTIEVVAAGDLVPPARPGDVSAVDATRLLDVIVFLEVRLAP